MTAAEPPTSRPHSRLLTARRLAPAATLLSIVVPVFDEQEVLPLFVARLRPVLDQMLANGFVSAYEVLFVDDGSRDHTVETLFDLGADWPQLQLLELRRNSGQQLAIAAGLRHARGDWLVTMDADLQDPPELLPAMLDGAAAKDVEVVYTCHADRASDGRIKSAAAAGYYRLVRRIAGVPVQPHVGDYRLMSRLVVDALNALPERHRVHRLLLPWLGFPSITLNHTRDKRPAGTTHYSVPRLIKLTTDSVVSFTTEPLRWATLLGIGTGILSLMLACGAVAARIAGLAIPGWASLAVMVTFIGGVQLICTGILGEYIGRVFTEVQRRPAYDVARVSRPAEGDASGPKATAEQQDTRGT
jgi:dolichol-phosphate mannosyltransferase